MTAHIHPEREMARLNFMLTQQQQHDDFNAHKKVFHSQLEHLAHRELRLKTELKMIEKHQQAKHQQIQHQQQLAQQYASDERFIQHRELA